MIVCNDNIRTNTIKTPRNSIVPYIKVIQEFKEVESNLITGKDIATATNRIYKINQVHESYSRFVSNFYILALEQGSRSDRFDSLMKYNRA